MSAEPFTIDDVRQDARGVVVLTFTNRTDRSIDVNVTIAQAERATFDGDRWWALHHVVVETSIGTILARAELLRLPVIFNDAIVQAWPLEDA